MAHTIGMNNFLYKLICYVKLNFMKLSKIYPSKSSPLLHIYQINSLIKNNISQNFKLKLLLILSIRKKKFIL